MNRRDFLKQAAAAGVVAINGVSIVAVAKTLSEPQMATLVANNFFTELWSKEILKAYKNNLGLSALTRR